MKQILPLVNDQRTIRLSAASGETSGSEQNLFQIEIPSSHKGLIHRDSIDTFGPTSVSPSFAMNADSFVDLNSNIKTNKTY